METIIREIENRIREREDNIRYSKQEQDRQTQRLSEEETTLAQLKKEFEVLKSQK